jgi:hypothetical protein
MKWTLNFLVSPRPPRPNVFNLYSLISCAHEKAKKFQIAPHFSSVSFGCFNLLLR